MCRSVGRSVDGSVGRSVGWSVCLPPHTGFHLQQKTPPEHNIYGLHVWAFAGHSRSFWVGIRGAFAGIRGHSASVRVIRPQEEMTKSLEFINTSLARAPPEPPRQKPKILVEQTLYIILKAKLHNYWQGEGGLAHGGSPLLEFYRGGVSLLFLWNVLAT